MSLRILRWIAAVLVAAAVIAAIVTLLGPLTDLIARHDVEAFKGTQQAEHLQGARETARTQLLTLGAGLFAAAALVYTARNFTLSRHGQVTNRYTQAIRQLGSKKPDVRIGGIYALERVAHDSARDHPTVMQVLGAFIREHSRELSPAGASGANAHDRTTVMQVLGAFIREHSRELSPAGASGANAHDRTRPDVQAAITVIGRRNPTRDRERIDLSGASLAGADLAGANLSSYTLTARTIAPAFKTLANHVLDLMQDPRGSYRSLESIRMKANLAGVDLTGADLLAAYLYLADLTGANLTGTDLTKANLTDANLTNANLTEANLTDANLANANLTEANLTGANLTGANLTGAAWPPDAVVPKGWQRDANWETRLKRADTSSGEKAPN